MKVWLESQEKMTEKVSRKVSGDFRFKEDVFVRLCDLAGNGQLQELKTLLKEAIPNGVKLGPTTFCPPPKYHLKAPFVQAAQGGHHSVVRYLLETHSDIIDIDCGATIQTKIQKIYTHNVPPLIAAATSGNLELVKYLVEKGADLHKLSLTRATPLRMASFYGYTDIMEYLIECGVDIDKANCVGSGPLLVAAHNGGPEAVKLLLEKGASIHQRTIEGYTVFHEACQRGKLEVVKLLLEYNLLPLFATSANSTDSGYIPCPLYLAASAGHSEIVDLLLEHKDCPLQCAVDAYLLLGTSKIEYPTHDDETSIIEEEVVITAIQELWLKALQIKEKNSIEIVYPPQRMEYSQSVEISTTDQLESLWDTPEFLEMEIYIQCLLIRDRVLGINDQSLIECLMRRGLDFCQMEWFKEAEGIWERAIQVEMHLSEVECSHLEYGYCDGLQTNIEGDLNDFVEGVQLMHKYQYVPNHDRYIQFGLAALQCLERASLANKADSETINYRKALILILKLVYFKVGHHHRKAKKPIEQLSSDPLIKELVTKYLFCTDGNTLLHLAIDIVSPLPQNRPALPAKDVCVFIEVLLMAGADEAVNIISVVSGDMPLHATPYFVEHCRELVQLLVRYGAHPDAVNSEGYAMMRLMNKQAFYEFLRGPLSLYCIVSNAIVKYALPYHSIGLPQHVVRYVDMHNHKSITMTKDTYFDIECT